MVVDVSLLTFLINVCVVHSKCFGSSQFLFIKSLVEEIHLWVVVLGKPEPA